MIDSSRLSVVEAGDGECLDQELCCLPHEEGSDPAAVVEHKSAGSGHDGDPIRSGEGTHHSILNSYQ